MSDLLDHYVYDDQVSRLQAEIARLDERIADHELDNEGLTKLVDAYKRVAVMFRRGFVLTWVRRDGHRVDVWVKDGRSEPAGSFDRDVVAEIARAYEEATRA